MIECASCHTLNPDAEPACMMCGVPLQAATLRCPAGHPIDPGWKSCPYCDRLRAGGDGPGRATRLEGAAAGGSSAVSGRPSIAPPPASGGSRATRLEAMPAGAPAAAPAPRRTVLAGASEASPPSSPGLAGPVVAPAAVPPPAPQIPQVSQIPARPLVAVLAAPALAGGTVFAVRQGKNTLGGDRASDVFLGADPLVSAEHALLLHRGTQFFLADRMSTNGTFVNGLEVPANGTVALRDRDRIRCGGVELIFLEIEPAGPSSGASVP